MFVANDASDNFCLSAEQVEAAITPRTRLVIVNSPNNPTGAVIPPAEFERIYEVCRSRGVLLMTDECYSHFTYGSAKPYSIASVPESKPNIIVIGSVSKTFAMTGWRIGYALGSQAADRRHDQDPEPVHVEPDIHRAIRRAGGADRLRWIRCR